MSKLVRFSTDDTTYYSLPANAAELSSNGEVVDDSILGQTFESQFTSLINWEVGTDAIYKGIPGYQVCLLKEGTSTATTSEAMELVSGKTYKTTDTSKDIWDASVTPVIYDDGSDVTDEVIEFNYLLGQVTFDSGYTIVGDITADVNYLPVAVIGRFRSFTLTQSVAAIDDSDVQTLKANGGYRVNKQGLRSVTLEASGIFDATEDFHDQLATRDSFVLEFQADGDGNSKARGYFRIGTASQSGAVGDTEEETVNFNLNVPSSDYKPFVWSHNSSSTLNQAILIALNAFNDESDIYVQYLPNGVGGTGAKEGVAVVTDISLSSSIDDMPRFTVTVTGDGSLSDV
ncbi:MAG: hypothetical protein Unbinned8472contig1000_5 [Prokaryotic dsDNA virus sp.]|nr:MAG: hypothetical protein Unbinned8472contig1000_5 [Prokaryotic dsDNA virus sp.]|tara:strand:+ start:17492 stop:18523 length:1032 start_codon:yes stop_codon:yes gene_type:complete